MVTSSCYATLIGRFGHKGAGRRLGIRINGARSPTLDELAEAARRCRLSVISYESFPRSGDNR